MLQGFRGHYESTAIILTPAAAIAFKARLGDNIDHSVCTKRRGYRSGMFVSTVLFQSQS